MSQNAVSIDPSSGSGAATPQPAPRSVDPGRQSEFAAHLLHILLPALGAQALYR